MNQPSIYLLLMRLKWVLTTLLLAGAITLAAAPPALLASRFLTLAFDIAPRAAILAMLALTLTGCLLILRTTLEKVDARALTAGCHHGIPPTVNPLITTLVALSSLLANFLGGLVISIQPAHEVSAILASAGIHLGIQTLVLITAAVLAGAAHAATFTLLMLAHPNIAAAYETHLRRSALRHAHMTSLESALAEHHLRLETAKLEAKTTFQQGRLQKEATQREIAQGSPVLRSQKKPRHT